MASDFYVAEDGSIHRHPVTMVNNTENCSNAYAMTSTVNAQPRTAYRPIHQVGVGRIAWFWIVSIIISVLIWFAMKAVIISFCNDNSWNPLNEAIPYVSIISSLVGGVIYGALLAKDVNYNLWAFVLSAFSSMAGMLWLMW